MATPPQNGSASLKEMVTQIKDFIQTYSRPPSFPYRCPRLKGARVKSLILLLYFFVCFISGYVRLYDLRLTNSWVTSFFILIGFQLLSICPTSIGTPTSLSTRTHNFTWTILLWLVSFTTLKGDTYFVTLLLSPLYYLQLTWMVYLSKGFLVTWTWTYLLLKKLKMQKECVLSRSSPAGYIPPTGTTSFTGLYQSWSTFCCLALLFSQLDNSSGNE